MAVTALFRIRGGEVIKVQLSGQDFSDADSTYWGVLTDPSRPDGDQVRDLSGEDGELGPLRVLGFAKFNDAGTVRNATQAEIDAFVTGEAEDKKDMQVTGAVGALSVNPRFRKAFKALALGMMDEINILRALHGLAPRTKAQLLTAVNDRVDRED